MLGSLILDLKGMRIMMFQLSASTVVYLARGLQTAFRSSFRRSGGRGGGGPGV